MDARLKIIVILVTLLVVEVVAVTFAVLRRDGDTPEEGVAEVLALATAVAATAWALASVAKSK